MPGFSPPSRSLIPESQLTFSAELARTVGLEGAVLLQQLKDVYRHQPATPRGGLGWLHVSHAYLLELMPFWDLATLLAVCSRMEELGLLRLDRRGAAAGCLLLAVDESAGRDAARRVSGNLDTPPAPAARSPQPETTPAAQSPNDRPPADDGAAPAPRRRKFRAGEGEPLPPDFVPDEDMLELLERFQGVPRAFALAQLEDFTLYWRERGSAGHAWQNRFRQHVQWHWKKHQQERAGPTHGGKHEAGGTRRTRDSSLEHDLTDTSWAD
jgi:hypothetical protein